MDFGTKNAGGRMRDDRLKTRKGIKGQTKYGLVLVRFTFVLFVCL